eukprot:3155584-Amphidinium_carterae.1
MTQDPNESVEKVDAINAGNKPTVLVLIVGSSEHIAYALPHIRAGQATLKITNARPDTNCVRRKGCVIRTTILISVCIAKPLFWTTEPAERRSEKTLHKVHAQHGITQGCIGAHV